MRDSSQQRNEDYGPVVLVGNLGVLLMVLKEETIGKNDYLSLGVSLNDSPSSANSLLMSVSCHKFCFLPLLLSLLYYQFETLISSKWIFLFIYLFFLKKILSPSRTQKVQLLIFLTAAVSGSSSNNILLTPTFHMQSHLRLIYDLQLSLYPFKYL